MVPSWRRCGEPGDAPVLMEEPHAVRTRWAAGHRGAAAAAAEVTASLFVQLQGGGGRGSAPQVRVINVRQLRFVFLSRPRRVVRWSPRAFTTWSSWNSVVLPQGSSLTFSSEGLCLVEPSTMKIISQRNWRLLTHASSSHDGEDLSLPIG